MIVPIRRPLLVGVFLLTLAFHAAIVWQDFAVLARNGFLYDDSFYAFKIAQNIARGDGVTFDGVTPTNGFQPLYVFLLVPMFKLAGANLQAPIYGALALSALCTALAAALLFLIARRYVSDGVAAVFGLLWGFSPVVIRQGANGLETALAAFLFAAVVYVYLTQIRPFTRPSFRRSIAFGVLVGLAILARVDQVFVALAILLDFLWMARKRKSGAAVLAPAFSAILACFAVYSPWLAYNALVMGNVLQDSGSATRFLSIAYAPFFDLGSRELVGQGPDPRFVWHHFVHALLVLKIAPPVHAFFRGLEKVGLQFGMVPLVNTIAAVVGLAAAAAVIRLNKCRVRGKAPATELVFLVVASAFLVASYAFYVFGIFFFIRYLFPVYFVLCIFVAIAAEVTLRRIRRSRPAVRRLAATGVAVYATVIAAMAFNCAFRSHPVYRFYDVARWVKTHTMAQETIGVFQGGAIGYLSGRHVVNLDGKVNRAALEALKTHSLDEYLRREGIDIVLDHTNVLDLFLDVRDQDHRTSNGLHQIMDGAQEGLPGWSAYRVEEVGVRAAGGTPVSPRSPSGVR